MNWLIPKGTSLLISQFDLPGQCRKYGVPLWQCPNFLFVIMGICIMAFAVFSYAIGTRFIEDPQITALGILVLTSVLLCISFIITRSFERMAEATRMKVEFVSIVSHQLRSPLSNMSWSLDFLTSQNTAVSKEKQEEYLQMLKGNTSRMIDLVRDLLLVSQLEENTVQVKKETFSFKQLLEDILRELEPSMNMRRVRVKVEGGDMQEGVSFDQIQLRHVITNLIDNAIRYSPEGNQVAVAYSQKGKNLLFSVTDQGIGIPKDDQKYIFQKFFRSQNAHKFQVQGSGLGLYIAKSIIEKGKGSMRFVSNEQKGSTFSFIIPL